ncbi:MAG: DegT/DnrJ/EryC1/StrS family aminotransferase [Marinilabiliaceae bacterium]|nr:DegT/DnrJ/EryC1/StrS family aminotransferase [Marinilabiliaceae bacterium]
MSGISIDMCGLQRQYVNLKSELDDAVIGVMERANYINGDEVKIFAEDLQNFLSVNHVIPCANGTDALQLALMALNLEPESEVITTAFSFVAPAEVILFLGLKPVFVDVDINTCNIDCNKIEEFITHRTKALLPVHLFGQGADMEAIMRISQKYQLHVIEDVAQSLGGTFQMGNEIKKLGTIGTIGCTSFFPTKNLACFGDGGACYTNSEEIASKIRMLAKHGSKTKYFHEEIGINSRLDTLQAAILNVKMRYFSQFISARINVANQYNSALINVPEIILPKTQNGAFHTYNQYTIRVINGKRDALKQYLHSKNIPTQIYYPTALNVLPVFLNNLKTKYDCPISERLCTEVLSLPVSTELKQEQIEYITENIITFFNFYGKHNDT